jgi:hypothetical protein
MQSEKKVLEHWIEYCLPNGLLHREDGPAVESFNGEKQWNIKGYAHRMDGPAVLDSQRCSRAYYIYDEKLQYDFFKITISSIHYMRAKHAV